MSTLLVAVLLWAASSRSVHASEGWQSGLQGDPRSVGRGGTGIVLSDDLWGVLENPAGSAMLVPGSTLQFSRNSIEDNVLLPEGKQLQMSSAGAVAPQTPWGFAASYTGSNQSAFVREYTVSGSRLFMDDHLSVGAGLTYGRSTLPAWGSTVGALYRFPKRVILGASFRSAMVYRGDEGPSFRHPWSFGVGAGTITNRFFRTEMGLRFLGRSLSSDSSVRVQPHAGAEYEFINLRQVKVRMYGGSYLENSRLHGTVGAGVDAWIFSVGSSVDLARDYRNYLFSVGIDLGRTLKKLRVLPSTVPAPAGGLFPNPLEVSDDWLARRIQDDPENAFQEIGSSLERLDHRIKNADQILKDQPKAIQDEIDSFSNDWDDLKEELR